MCIYGKITQYKNLDHNINKTTYPCTFKKYECLWKMQSIFLNFASQNISLLMTAIMKNVSESGLLPRGYRKEFVIMWSSRCHWIEDNGLVILKRESFPLIKSIYCSYFGVSLQFLGMSKFFKKKSESMAEITFHCI